MNILKIESILLNFEMILLFNYLIINKMKNDEKLLKDKVNKNDNSKEKIEKKKNKNINEKELAESLLPWIYR